MKRAVYTSQRPTVPDFSRTIDLHREREARLQGKTYIIPENRTRKQTRRSRKRPVVIKPLLVVGGGLAILTAAAMRKKF